MNKYEKFPAYFRKLLEDKTVAMINRETKVSK